MINFDSDLVVAFLARVADGDVSEAQRLAVAIIAQEESSVLELSNHECYTDTEVLVKLMRDEYFRLAYATVREAYDEIAPKIIELASCYLHLTTEHDNGNPEPSSEPVE